MSKDNVLPIPDEILMAFADGELDSEELTRVERAIEASPAMQERVEMFLQTRLQAHSAFQSILKEPVPARLLRSATQTEARMAISGHDDIPPIIKAPRQRSFFGSNRAGFAMAASLVGCIAAATLGYLAGQRQNAPTTAIASLAGNERAMTELLNQGQDGAKKQIGTELSLTVTASYRTSEQSACRSLEASIGAGRSMAQALACNLNGNWQIKSVLATEKPNGTFRPASATASIETLIEAMGLSDPLKPAEVKAHIERSWR